MAPFNRHRLLRSGSAAAATTALIWACYVAPTAAQSTAAVSDQSASNQSTAATGGLEVIVVTAQKRSETISDVGMSTSALSGDELKTHAVNSIDDFAKIDTSFTFGRSLYGTPTYTIRGIGYYDFALAAAPRVSAYVDQVPLAYSALTKGVTRDLERVDIRKRPQGTLFGQEATAGAINFIAARPTPSFEAGPRDHDRALQRRHCPFASSAGRSAMRSAHVSPSVRTWAAPGRPWFAIAESSASESISIMLSSPRRLRSA